MEALLSEQGNGLPGMALGGLIELMTVVFFSALRVGAFLLASPFFGAQSIPLQVRIVTAMVLSIVFFGQIDPSPILNAGLLDLTKIIFVELFTGLCMGLLLSILFASVALAGEKIAASGGLGFAAQVDPNTGGQTPVISNIMTLFLVVTFLSLDGHLALIRTISQSYVFLPFGGNIPLISTSEYGINAAGQMFHIATVIMLPIVSLLLLTNFAIGVITRSAPTLNLFSFGFPMTLMVVFVALYSFATPLGYAMQEVSEFSLDFVAGFLTGLTNGQ